MHLLGVNLPDGHLVYRALRSFYGLNYHLSQRLCSRFQIHLRTRVSELTDPQISALSAYLSSPSTVAPPLRCQRAPPGFRASLSDPLPAPERSKRMDDLALLKLESEGRRVVRENIAHYREIGTYRGRRHAMGFPVRGQNTQSNARTARRMNRLERRGYVT
ncbi:mitochondrial 30S ribosomal protein S13 [Dacryopinax primogenitus]|uniref:Mitochondrial 30S ribosomal protein S13 n=1 Tax=Dacryopinax primogenitus (strain DJM 731) TaxID=1858805 RepID=M5GAB3_DACPD|nr:mitochondrial 30S ribosomal protein S13 [Dacryopinax primogenitus]EJU05275.1 mitochondrial 30S ribosomal protein S13 [Dacryopinax primogenitus]